MSDEQNEQQEPGLYIPPSPTWPGEIRMDGLVSLPEQTLEVSGPLSDEQEARSSALYHARANLERRGGPFGSNSSSTTLPSVDDLLRVAQWIMDGDDGEADH